jgi:nucleoside-diphosphate-sugar epimerase
MRILIMGGTRFIGVYLTQILHRQGHEVVLFNRGKKQPPIPGIQQIHGDRQDPQQLKDKLGAEEFDAIFDNNGRELSDTQPLVELFQGRLQHFIYISSAGVYRQSDQMPHQENDPVDPKSRHRGKFATEEYLSESGIPWTSVRPTYIYGPKNYNPLESWFFDRLSRRRPIPIPGNGQYITQLGHVEDLALALAALLAKTQTFGQIYNISGDRYVTFDGLARACAEAMGQDPQTVKLVHYDPKEFDFGKRKAFPLRTQHFFADIHKAQADFGWTPKLSLAEGLRDAYENDYCLRPEEVKPDFSCDEEILAFL